jgi:hypothetical protein
MSLAFFLLMNAGAAAAFFVAGIASAFLPALVRRYRKRLAK